MHHATIITDLTFGDAGKGSLTDALVRRGANLVVRYNGGAQAAHTVIDGRGRCHIFHQFGSGTLVEGARTLLSRHMLVNPLALHYEAQTLGELGVPDAAARMRIDGRALVTTPDHMAFNQLRELARGANRHGSCGLGIGETASDALDFGSKVLRFGDLSDAARLGRKLRWHRDLKLKQLEPLMAALLAQTGAEKTQICALLDPLHCEDEFEAAREVFCDVAARFQVAPPGFLASHLSQPGSTVFEGAQGVLLDENWGFHPHTTWSNTTPANALQLIAETGVSVSTRVLGLTRCYGTRHGAGPFPTENAAVAAALSEPHNPTNAWQGAFRAGWLDLPLLRYAVAACGGIDGLVMTCLDRLGELPEAKIGAGYRLDGKTWHLGAEGAGNLLKQERNGQNLREVEVQYQSAPSEPHAYAQEVASRLGVPLSGTSSGPTAREKWFAF